MRYSVDVDVDRTIQIDEEKTVGWIRVLIDTIP